MLVLANGIGSFFLRCHVCHATSPSIAKPDHYRILAAAKNAGWKVVQVEKSFRLYCDTPLCQRQVK